MSGNGRSPIGWLGPVLCGILLLAAAGTSDLPVALDYVLNGNTPIEIFLRLVLVAIPIGAAMGTVLILTARRSDGTLKKGMITPRWLWLALLGIVLFTAGPLFIALPAVVVPAILGCGGSAGPCTVLGIDIEGVLLFFAVFHWLFLFTMPTGALAFIAWLAVALGLLVRSAFHSVSGAFFGRH
jgi:hypothetical protein